MLIAVILVASLSIVLRCSLLVLEYTQYHRSGYYTATQTPFWKIRWNLGKYGEYLTYRQLRKFEKEGARFLFNLYIPKTNGGTSEIDVVMICSKGIFVLESKNYSGWIFGNEAQKNWCQTLPRRGESHKEFFYNPIMQNNSHITHLREFLNYESPIWSIIVFSNRCELKNVTYSNKFTRVIKRCNLSLCISGILGEAEILSEDELSSLYHRLLPFTNVSQSTKEQHIASVAAKKRPAVIKNQEPPTFSDQASEAVALTHTKEENISATPDTNTHQDHYNDISAQTKICPQCGGSLIIRTATRGKNIGSKFWGCSNFPKCRYILPLEVNQPSIPQAEATETSH